MHLSTTSVVLPARVVGGSELPVVIKFLFDAIQYDREIEARVQLNAPARLTHGASKRWAEIDAADRRIIRGLPFPILQDEAKEIYVVIMERGDKNLLNAISDEWSDPTWSEKIRAAIEDIASGLKELHSQGVTHGDVKPRNIVRFAGVVASVSAAASARGASAVPAGDSGGGAAAPTSAASPSVGGGASSASVSFVPRAPGPPNRDRFQFRLIDLDASRPFHTAAAPSPIGPKLSTAYAPPEALTATPCGTCAKAVRFDWRRGEMPSTAATDAWGLGASIYEMLTSQPLFRKIGVRGKGADEIDDDELPELAAWDDAKLQAKLRKIPVGDAMAKDLVGQLLARDPAARPSMDFVLNHPFVTGFSFDVFISHRWGPDDALSAELYSSLSRRLGGVAKKRVFFDRASSTIGQPEGFEREFCAALSRSRVFVPIISRAAVHRWVVPDGRMDHVLLEHRLARELAIRGRLAAILPVFVGEGSDSSAKPFANAPAASDAVVSIVEDELRRLATDPVISLGLSAIEPRSPKQVMDFLDSILHPPSLPGCFEGPDSEEYLAIIRKIVECTTRAIADAPRLDAAASASSSLCQCSVAPSPPVPPPAVV